MPYTPGQRLVRSNPEVWNDRIVGLETAVNGDELANQLNQYTAAGAVTPQGTAVLQAGSAAAMTLAAPTAGPQPAGQDGVQLDLIAADAFAYTVTTPANAIHGSKHVMTWTAGIGNSITLIASNGVWYNVGTPNGVAIS